jgi:membrane-bound lytic murein transglycosylase A
VIRTGNLWRPRATADRTVRALVSAALALVMSYATATAQNLPDLRDSKATPVAFSALAGWLNDNHLSAWHVFRVHCAARSKAAPALRAGANAPTALDRVCAEALQAGVSNRSEARIFFERWFQPLEIVPPSGSGFLTGYYEPETTGSLVKTDAFQAPLLARPEDVVTIPQGELWPGVPEGFAAARKTPDGGHAVYPDRASIMRGEIAAQTKPILWLKDDVEVFFMQVQGSGRVRLPGGQTVRIAYSGRNGHPYSSIGRIVVQEGLMRLEDATLDKLKTWLRANPVQAKRIMEMNRSYVFFRLAEELSDASGPIGGAGLPLTPWRSIAVDRTIWAYGLPVWLEVDLPVVTGVEAFRRLTIAEDTGSAILGPARADLFHGSGDDAGSRAGVLRHPMRFVVLWPKDEP